MRRVVPFSILSLALTGCGGATAPSAPASAQTAPSVTAAPVAPIVRNVPPLPREDGRLPSFATPLRYNIALEIDPAQPRFRGTATIDVEVPEATRYVVLHARDMNVARAVARGAREITAIPTIRMGHGGVHADELVLFFNEALPKGRATLEIQYDAPFAADLAGLYRVKEGDRWYAFTQFESTDARRAFPCFDEPSFKVPFDIAITAPRGMIAVANTPEASRADSGSGTRFTFATTPPLPSYLVAMAVGDLEVRQGSTSPVPIRLITAKGKSALGEDALKATRSIVDILGDYFGIQYASPKLDIVAVPELAAGAMENPGLVTFREELLLQEHGHAPMQARQRQVQVIAHELAHIWFGDLVTTKWWNDTWLNEGFAAWMEAKASDRFDPSLEVRVDAVADTQRVMDLDGLTSARAVRQPVASVAEAAESFDRITYKKGAAVLGMIEHWVGEDAFQRGVRAYIADHAWKNATAEDLLRALDKASGRDVSGMAATFLDRAGVPNVTVRASCAGQKATFDLKQAAWHPLGIAPASASPWRIPVCVHDAGAKAAECTDMTAEAGALESKATKCPTWSFPNAAEAGYYRFSLPEKEMRALAKGRAELDVPSRIGFVANLWAQVRAGELAPEAMLDTLPSFDDETDRNVVKLVTDSLADVDDALVTDAARSAYRKYVAARMAKQKARLGWTAKKGEAPANALLRAPVLQALGEIAEDPATLAEAEALAKAWLKDPRSVDPDAAPIALRLASRRGGAARLAELRSAIAHAATPQDRVTALGALGTFAEPAVLRSAFDVILTDDVKRQDLRYIVRPVLEHRASSMALLKWLEEHWDAVHAKMPGQLVRLLVDVAQRACTQEEHDEASAFFTPRVREIEGLGRPLAQALDQSAVCVAVRAHGAAAVEAKLAKR